MNYIYDILLNFQPVLYDFYEWNDEDDITHIRKIPIFKVSQEEMQDLKNYVVEMNSSFLSKIKNKTEMFQKKSVKQIEYAALFTDGLEAVATLFQKGKVQLKSRLLLDEEEDLLEMSETMELTQLTYQKKKNIVDPTFYTRKEKARKQYIQKELSKINNREQLAYLYFECFDEKPKEEDSIKKEIKENLISNFEETSMKLYNFFKLLYTKK